MEKIIGIYKITSPTKKVYIGQSVDIKKRLSVYKSYNCKKQASLYNSLKKHGFNNHKIEIIHHCGIEDLNKLEVYYIQLHKCFNSKYGLNLRSGGFVNSIMSDQTKIKISLAKRNPSPEIRARMSEGQKGHQRNLGSKRSEESKLKMSLAAKQNTNCLGFKHTIETKLKMSIAKRLMTDETKLKLSEASKGNKHSVGRKHTPEAKAKISLAQLSISQITRDKMRNSAKGRLTSIEAKKNMSLAQQLRRKREKRCLVLGGGLKYYEL